MLSEWELEKLNKTYVFSLEVVRITCHGGVLDIVLLEDFSVIITLLGHESII